MVVTAKESEREYLLQLAEDYRDKGYRTIFQPEIDALPDFLKGYKPDMLALGSHESVVVEVKARPLKKGDSEYLKSLSQSIEKNPGWRFELVILASEEERNDYAFEDSSLSQETLQIEDIEAGLRFARNLSPSQPESALLYTWSLAEAILRLLAKSEQVSLKSFNAAYLIKALVLEGVISRSDYQTLTNLLPMRNAVAHGFKVDELNSNMVGELIALAQQLLLLLNSSEAVS